MRAFRFNVACYFLANVCVDFRKSFGSGNTKALSFGCHLEMSSLLLMSAENTESLTFVSLMFCFWGFVNCDNELFFSYLWSFVHEFTSSSTNPIAS